MGVGMEVDNKHIKMACILYNLEQKGVYNWENLPQLCLPFFDWYKSYDFSDWNLIEFGSGKSTNWFSDTTKHVTSFETDYEFFNNLKDKLNNNIDYKFIEKEKLEDGIFEININDKTFVIVDSDSNRYKTTKHILEKGMPNILILDNSEWYPNTCEMIRLKGYIEAPFWGIRPDDCYDKCTSVFFKSSFTFQKKLRYFPVGSEELHHPYDFI
jgi:hypothetical protein